MGRKISDPEMKNSVQSEEQKPFDSSNIVNVRFKRVESIETRGISFQMMLDVKMCQRVVRELTQANVRIRGILDEIYAYKLSGRDLSALIMENRSKLSKFSIVQSDCYWERMDSDLSQVLAMLETCHDALFAKKYKDQFVLSDLLYMINVLETMMREFEKKIEQIEEIIL